MPQMPGARHPPMIHVLSMLLRSSDSSAFGWPPMAFESAQGWPFEDIRVLSLAGAMTLEASEISNLMALLLTAQYRALPAVRLCPLRRSGGFLQLLANAVAMRCRGNARRPRRRGHRALFLFLLHLRVAPHAPTEHCRASAFPGRRVGAAIRASLAHDSASLQQPSFSRGDRHRYILGAFGA